MSLKLFNSLHFWFVSVPVCEKNFQEQRQYTLSWSGPTMGASEKFCLKWNDFETNISGAFRELREEKDFFDVTLACDDSQIQAHKVPVAIFCLLQCVLRYLGLRIRNRIRIFRKGKSGSAVESKTGSGFKIQKL
jgi:hypothetical protein